MPSVGYATLQVIPSVRGIGDEIRRQLVGPAADAGEQAGERAGGGLKDNLLKGAAAAGVAAGALLVKGLGDAIGQSNVTAKLQAQLGTSHKVAAQQGKLAGKLYSSGVTDSFEGAANAIKGVMQSGLAPPGATTKQLQALATKASDVATVFDQDLGGVTNAVAQMLRTGLAKNANEAFDVLTRGFQTGANKADDLLDTVTEYGTQFRKAGLTGSDAIGLINQALQAGARDGDIAADSIKEFSIRAVDGSKTTAAGFKALGLNADSMAAKFGQGGTVAKAALDLTLDRLRGIKDPVAQSQAAVNLFGTQAEDLGQALFAMDPSRATAGLGKLGGSAKKLGDDVRSGPAHELQVFARTMQQSLVDFLGGKVLPVLGQVGGWLKANVLPPLSMVAGVVGSILVPALSGLWSVGQSVVSWLQSMGAWLIPIAIAVGGLTLALTAQQLAVAATTAVFSIYRGAILAWSAVQRGATIAQAAFNAVMNANPVMLIITAILALGAAVVVAYNRVGWFRAAVQAAWAGIQAAAMWAWNNVLKPAFAGLVAAFKAIGAAASWLWTTVLQPVFGFIATAAKILATVIGVIVIGPIILAVKLLGAIFSWLWTTVLSPVIGWIVAGFKLLWAGVQVVFGYLKAGFKAIGAAFSWLWTNVLSPVVGWIVAKFKLWWAGTQIIFGYIKAGFRAVGSAFRWLWTAVLQPVVNWIVAGFKLLWAGVKIVFGYLKTGFKTVADAAKWLWNNGVKPVLGWIADKAKWLWNNGLKPAFDLMKGGIRKVGDSFSAAKDFISKAWGGLQEIAKKPVRFIIGTVYNKGIVPMWNKIAGAFGAPKLETAKGFSSGGHTGPGGKYRPAGIVHAGEFVTQQSSTKAIERNHPGALDYMNRTGRLPGYASGGLVGDIWGWTKHAASTAWDKVKQGASWVADTVKASAKAGVEKLVSPLINQIAGSASTYKSMVTRIPKKAISSLLGYSDTADKKLDAAGFVGGKGFKAGLRWARTQNGKRYQWGGNGNPSWDCSGFMSAIESVIRGQKPHRRWATGAFPPGTPGWKRNARSPFMIGITNSGVGHTAGTINGVNVESRGGDGVVVGPRARGYKSSLFSSRWGLRGFASGGRPGRGEMAWVGEQGPELVRFRGGEEVYDHRTSMAMASGLNLRGFAKGSRAAQAAARARTKARGEVGGDLKEFTKSLTGSAASIASASKALAKDLSAAGGAGKRLASSTNRTSARLQSLSKQRDAVGSKIDAARSFAADQKKAVTDYVGLGQFSSATGLGDVLSGLETRLKTVKDNRSNIAGLAKRGLSKTAISQLSGLGLDSTLPGILASATNSEIKTVNRLLSQGSSLATSYGNGMADLLYDSGKNASKGFLAGLLGQEKQIQAAMNRLGAGLVKGIKKSLRIKSPSRVMRDEVGAQVGAGLVVGMDATASSVAAAAARMANTAAGGGYRPQVTPGIGWAVDGSPVVVEVHTKDESLADFIEVKVRGDKQRVASVVRAGRSR
ncbi:phage tail tape measure protein [Streptomyces sp. Isolate_219]|uniref:phage tail tape measure protein n=1 Tax=Streptomyces sp. Isolate_219 TaxID=2950110 RepID=UPI0021C679FB|nr:phage tail tape measure protein [Streptomyces sp. Isolate_219]MCR8574670.1 phage tail tape measure protein [Streptomyces sp. Isolate_219]